MRRGQFSSLLLALTLTACSLVPNQLLPPPAVVDLAPLTPGPRQQFSALTGQFQAAPKDFAVNIEMGRTLFAYELYPAAETYLRRAAVLRPWDFESRFLLGWLYMRTGQPREALGAFDAALRRKWKHIPAMIRRADALRALERHQEAEAAYRKIVDADALQPLAKFGLAKSLIGQGKNREAIEVLQPLLEAYRNYGAAHYAAAEAYRKLGDTERARVHLASYQADRSFQPPLQEEIIAAVRERNRNHRNLVDRAIDVAKSGDWNRATELLEEALRDDDSYVTGHVNLITAYGKLGNIAKAELHYRKGHALSPDSSVLENAIGEVYRSNRQGAAAKEHFLKAIALDATCSACYENLGAVALDAGDPREALHCFEKSAALVPASIAAWMKIGVIRLRTGNPDAAREAFMQTIRPGPQASAAVIEIRNTYNQAKDRTGWAAFAKAAAVRAKQQGLAAIANDLEGESQ